MAYSSITWAKARADYEGGKYSAAQLSKKYRISEATIWKRIASKKWKKGKLAEQVEDKILTETEKMFVKAGMPKQELVNQIVEGIKHGQLLTSRVLKLFENAQSTEDVMNENTIDMVKRMYNDRRTQLNFIQELNKMVGNYAPIKKDITTGGHEIQRPLLILPDNQRGAE